MVEEKSGVTKTTREKRHTEWAKKTSEKAMEEFKPQTTLNPLRWWGVRHIRYWFKMVRFNYWWINCGQYLGAFPNKADTDYLDAIWKGEA